MKRPAAATSATATGDSCPDAQPHSQGGSETPVAARAALAPIHVPDADTNVDGEEFTDPESGSSEMDMGLPPIFSLLDAAHIGLQ
jgi:hypothetical protein